MKGKYIIAYALVSLLAIVLVVALGSGKPKKQTNKEPVQNTIMQTKDDLLAGEYKAVCYSGFRSGQHPDRGEGAINPTAAQVLEDLFIIQNDMGFKLIRLYDSGENSKTVLEVIQKNDLDIKVMQGIWLKAELSAHETCEWLTEPIPQETLNKNKIINKEEIQRGISLANKYDSIIVAISVGNEALVDWNDHKVHADSIIKYCKIVSKSVKQPITVADNYLWWAHHGKKLSKVLDFISIHVYPVWEGKDINEGLSYSIQNIQQVRDSLPEARIVISEAGWATTATEFGERASEEKQKTYYEELMSWSKEMNITTFFFEAFDEDWKGNPDNPLGAEKHWGLYKINRTPKLVMSK